MVHVRKILYPTDFSSYSNVAYFHAVALAEAYGAGLTVVFVYSPGLEPSDRRHWRALLEQIRPVNPAIAVRHVFLEGNPAAEITRYAADANLDLIVMGTHGPTGVERLLMGSVAEQVLRGAPCSVLVVKMAKGQPGVAPAHVQ